MLIQCPNCEICYQIEKDILPEGGRKFRCAKCGQVWQARPEDAFEATDDVKIYGVHNEGATSASDSASASESTLEPDSSSESFQAEEGGQTQLSADTPEPVAEDAAATEAAATADSAQTAESTPADDSSSPADADPSPADGATTPEQQSAADPSPADGATTPEQQSAADPSPSEGGLSSDMQEMFSRLNKQTEIIENFDKNASAVQKGMRMASNSLHWHNPLIRGIIVLVLLLLILLSLFSFRYEITRNLPFMESFYKAFGFESVVIGEGLEFNNVNRREYEEDYIRKLEIKGLILNKTEEELAVPTILVELLDKNGDVLQRQTVNAPTDKLASGERTAFMFVITQPSTLTKYVYLTFTKAVTPSEGNTKSRP